MRKKLMTTDPKMQVVVSRKQFDAVIFDLDGVVTKTAEVHAAAWKQLFDEYREERLQRALPPFEPFDKDMDYRKYVDGKPRYAGIKSFLKARAIDLPPGDPDDPPGKETICGLGNRKNQLFQQRLARDGVEVYDSTVRFIRELRNKGFRVAIISASRNCSAVLAAGGLQTLFHAQVDGVEADRHELKGKPAPDIFIEAAKRLQVTPARCVVVEDALAGVEAGRRGAFGLVIGVDRCGKPERLSKHGADKVVATLTQVMVEGDADSSWRDAADLSWTLSYEGFQPEQESLREALCTIGNGYFATRGAAPESAADEVHYPGTYLAGGYNRLKSEVAGRVVENEDLVNLPNWLALSFRIGEGDWFDLAKVEILFYRQELDLKHGVLTRTVRFRDEKGQCTTLTQRRIVSMAQPHLAALETTWRADNWSGQMEVCSALDGRVVNNGVARYRKLNDKHLVPVETGAPAKDSIFLKVRTSQSELSIAQAARTRWFHSGQGIEPAAERAEEPGYVAQYFKVELAEGAAVTAEKVITLFTSRDHAISECGLAAREAVGRAADFAGLLRDHAQAWQQLWERFDMELELADAAAAQKNHSPQLILHLHIFHLLQTTSPHTMDLDTGVPSRGWHGEAYRGHIFWDELFIFPLLNLRIPDVTQALLKYRYRRLDAARYGARAAGYAGAMYPWQSGSDGREESQVLHLNPRSGRWLPDNSHRQRHINAAIVYNIWQYYQISNDREFLYFHGVESILEIARFWASLATFNPDLDRYEILGVMGPDEYHDAYPGAEQPGLNNNAYTNLMAVWVLCRALELLDLIPNEHCARICQKLAVKDAETAHWQDISRKMRLVFHEDGILSQFEGYADLKEFDWETYREKHGQAMRLDRILEAEGDTPNRYKASKQADVLMLFYLFSAEELEELFVRLGYSYAPEMIRRNIDYYLSRTSNGSTLSNVVNSWVLARSDRSRSWHLFTEALQSDFADVQGGTTPEGIHLGAMAGTVDLIQRCYTGIEARAGVLWVNPQLPEELACLRLRIRYHEASLCLQVTHHFLRVRVVHCPVVPIRLGFDDHVMELREGEEVEMRLAMPKS